MQKEQAFAYIKSLRNYGKHEYALAYWRCIVEGGKSPDRKDYQISYMAAQAVRMNLEALAN